MMSIFRVDVSAVTYDNFPGYLRLTDLQQYRIVDGEEVLILDPSDVPMLEAGGFTEENAPYFLRCLWQAGSWSPDNYYMREGFNKLLVQIRDCYTPGVYGIRLALRAKWDDDLGEWLTR